MGKGMRGMGQKGKGEGYEKGYDMNGGRSKGWKGMGDQRDPKATRSPVLGKDSPDDAFLGTLLSFIGVRMYCEVVPSREASRGPGSE